MIDEKTLSRFPMIDHYASDNENTFLLRPENKKTSVHYHSGLPIEENATEPYIQDDIPDEALPPRYTKRRVQYCYHDVTELYTHSYRGRVMKALDKYFRITERGSTISTEIRAGIVTFLTMSYIILVNPQVLMQSGIPQKQAAAATCVAACVSSFIIGVLGNLPFGCAPGVGLSAYFTYGLVLVDGGTDLVTDSDHPKYKEALTIAFIAGGICFIAWLTTISQRIMDIIPSTIKIATIVGMGLFLSFVGMWNIRLVTYGAVNESVGTAPVQLGDLTDWTIWLSLASLAFITLLAMYEVKGYLLIGVALSSLIYFAGTGKWPTHFMEFPSIGSPYSTLIFSNFTRKYVTGVLSFLLILIFDVSGVVYSVGDMCGLLDPIHGTVEGGSWALFAASVGTMLSAAIGGSPIIVHLESMAGAISGGRTGLTAVVISFLFGLATFLSPLFGAMPLAATAPVLVFVGTLMMKQTSHIDWSRMELAVPAFLTIAMMPFTFSIANGIFFGLTTYSVFWCFTGKFMHFFGKKSWAPGRRDESWDATEIIRDNFAVSEGDDPEERRISSELKLELAQCRGAVEKDLSDKLDSLFGGMDHWLRQKYKETKSNAQVKSSEGMKCGQILNTAVAAGTGYIMTDYTKSERGVGTRKLPSYRSHHTSSSSPVPPAEADGDANLRS